MSESIWPTIHAERKALAADLNGLTDEQWALATMCGDWNVHQVLAHELSLATMTKPKFFGKLAASGFKFSNYTAKEVAAGTANGPAATLAAFVAAEPNETTPPGPMETWLGEVFVHGEDIRRPLGIKGSYPLPEVTRAIAFYSGSDLIIGGKSRIAGVTMKATDTEFSVGAGPAVEGPAISLLLAASGRKSALDELSGPGVDVLRQRS